MDLLLADEIYALDCMHAFLCLGFASLTGDMYYLSGKRCRFACVCISKVLGLKGSGFSVRCFKVVVAVQMLYLAVVKGFVLAISLLCVA